VIAVAQEDDARRVMAVLPKRFGTYGPTLHPEKTRLVDFRKPGAPAGPRGPTESGRPGTFDLLGFTHHWARSRKGHWVIKQQTAASRFSRAAKRIGEWCREHRHRPVPEQREALAQKLRGHYGYDGITGNSPMLVRVLSEVKRRWRYWLNRRSQRGRWTRERFVRVLGSSPLPPATPVHSIYRHAAKP
jgi:hypothetical protein